MFLGAAVRNPAWAIFEWRTGVNVSEIRPAEKAAGIAIPTMVVHGDSDGLIPMSSGRALFDSFPERTAKRWLPVPTADHDNVLVTDFPLYATMAEWILTHSGDGSPASAPR